jgi:tRNA threonylcarbamoyl adenosine modification protein (Sua5/YciO/YrdC/YwlC family)
VSRHESPLDAAIRAARGGKLIVVPTDTVYGVATRADDVEATDRLFEAKRRDHAVDLPVFVPSLDEAERVASLDARARALAARYWPGGLTMVLPRSSQSAAWSLGASTDTIGLRVPAHPLAAAVTEGVGALAITSANLSGQPVATTADELVSAFGDRVEVYLCEDEPLPSRASTVVDLTGPDLRILREGPISMAELEEVLGQPS